MNHNVAYHFFETARNYPEKIALEDGGTCLTYGELLEQVQRTAHYFRSQGIGQGDRVLVAVPMGMKLYRIVLALFFIGATAVFLDEWVSFKRMEMCCAIAQCKGFIANWKGRLIRLVSRELRAIPIRLSLSGMQDGGSLDPENVPAETVALLTFTTGSTGVPKAANRTHDFLNTQFRVLRDKVGGTMNDRELTNLPIVLLINLGVGSSSVIGRFNAKKPHRTDFAQIFRQINEQHINRLVVSPYFLTRLCAYMHEKKQLLPAVKQVFTGGGPLFVEEAQIVLPFFPNAQMEVVYGSTEAEPISSIDMRSLAAFGDTALGLPVGLPSEHADVRIIPIQEGVVAVGADGLLELKPNEIGEIVVAGPHVLKHYFNNEEANRLVKIPVGGKIYHRTGDSGYKDADGMLFLTGRCNQVINWNGTYWYPFLLEQQLASLRWVMRGAAIADENRFVVFLQLQKHMHGGNFEKDLETLGIPFTEIRLVRALPMDPRHHTKVDYTALERLLLKNKIHR